MKVLSLLQPWASLVVMGHKKIETRSWNTKHRGPLLIHASVGTQKAIRRWLNEEPFRSCLSEKREIRNVIESHWDIPRGAIIGMVNVESCVQFSRVLTSYSMGEAQWPLTEQERAFGDYSEGRFGWLLSNPVLFKEPIPAKGSLGLWTPDVETMGMISKQIELLNP